MAFWPAHIYRRTPKRQSAVGVLCMGGRTDDVMKLLMVGFEGLFHLCNPSAVLGWHAIGGQSWSRFLDLTDEYPDQTSAAIFQYSKKR